MGKSLKTLHKTTDRVSVKDKKSVF